MAAKVLNIEVGDQTIEVCRAARKGKGIRVFDSFLFPTPENCVSDGAVLNPELVAQELKAQLSSHGLQGISNVVFVQSSSKTVIREIKLPRMKKNLISTAIRTNADDYFPIDLQSYHLTYSLLETATNKKPYNRILVMASPLSLLESYFQLAEKAGLTLKSIDTRGNSQYQLLKNIDSKGVTAYIDVSGASCIISFMKDNKLLMQRTFAFGVEELISHYMRVSDKTAADYLAALDETDTTSPAFVANKLLSLSDVQNDLSRLLNSIMRSFDYFNSNQIDITVTHIVLIGLNRHIIGLRELVAEATGLETTFIDEIPDFAVITDKAQIAPSFISCIGAAIAPLDLLPPQFVSPKKKPVPKDNKSNRFSIAAAAVIISIAVLVSVLTYLSYSSTEKKLIDTENEISSLQPAKAAYDCYTAYQESEKQVNALSEGEDSPNSKLVDFFKELEQKMPSSILLLSANCETDGVTMNITVGSYTDAAAVISALRSFDSLSAVEVSDLTSAKDELGFVRVSFTAACTYGTNPYLNSVNPYDALIASASPSPDASPDTSGNTAAAASPSPSTGTATQTQGQ